MVWRISLCLLVACKQQPTKLDPPAASRAGIVVDGSWREPAWNARAQRGVFVNETGGEARPYSEIRLVREGAELFVALYAADEDIRKAETFDFTVGGFALQVSAGGTLHRRLNGELVPPPPEVRAAVEADGSVEQPSDDDEEWIVEVVVPSALISGSTVEARRCDHPKAGGEHCGSWRGTAP